MQGSVPESYESLLALPGIGPYTAAAIASIAFNQDIAVVDANVERILARLFDIDGPIKNSETKKRIHRLAGELLPPGQARFFNQALMDLGGLSARRRIRPAAIALWRDSVPHCTPVASTRGLWSFLAGRPSLIEMATGVLAHRGRLFIQQRLAGDVWGSLWEFPGGRLEAGETPEETVIREYREETGFAVAILAGITTVVHHYMKYKVILHGFHCRLTEERTEPELQAAQDFRWVAPKDLADYGFPAGHRKLIEYMTKSCPELSL